MKVNLKKMGAIVAGATMLASSAAFAGLLFGSTTLVDDNGAPVAKVVVGSNSQPSDGVAGALIAAKIASEAYKSQTLEAEVSGTADCVGGEAASDAKETCSISNETARLEITVPGSVAAGTWQGENLIGDYLNRELEDREDNIAGDSDSEYEIGGSDTADNANLFTDGNGGDIGLTKSFLYKIDGNAFSVFQDVTVQDADAGNTYIEMQSMWLEGSNRFDTDEDDIIGQLDFIAYALKFDGPGGEEIGIPVCTESEDNDFTFCKSTDGDIDDASETHRVKIKFLGEDWIISEMEAPNTSTLTDENTLVNGGMVKLAKESIGGILNQGDFLQVADLKFQLDDLEAHGDTTSAIISILDANDNILKKEKVDPGQTQEFNINGNTYRFHVYKVAPGYTFGAKWADVAIFSHEIECEDGQDLDADEDSNPDYQCALGWKNLNAETGAPVANGGDPEAPDALRTIVVYSEDVEDISSSGETELSAGDYVPIVQEPDTWRLSYKGLDITSEDRHSLKFEIKTQDRDISESKGPAYNAGNAQSACTIYAPYIEVSSGDSGSVFEADRDDGAGAGTLSDDQFFVAINDAECDSNSDGVVTGADLNVGAGSVFMLLSPSSDQYGVDEYAAPGVVVRYDDIGDGDSAFAAPDGGAIAIQDVIDIDGAGDGHIGDLFDSAGYDPVLANWNNPSDFMIGVAEKAGTGSSNEYVDYFVFGVQGVTVPADATFDFDSDDGSGNTLTSDSEEILYGHATSKVPADAYDGVQPIDGPVDSGIESVEEGYVSERGSVFTTMSENKVEFDMAHTLAKAQWWLGPTSTSTGSGSTTVVTLGEGESTTVSGVTVKVLEIITEDVGACSAAGGAVSCTADMSGVSAVIMPNNAASVKVAMPYTGNYGNLVILDSDAVGVNTLISVGGDAVNTVTADLLQGSAVDWTVEKKVVREVVQGSKIVVAGENAADTLSAAQDFVSQVQKV